jgi:hypothetical protein
VEKCTSFTRILALFITLGIMLFIITCCQGTPTPPVTPTPERESEGTSGPKKGEPTPAIDNPPKNQGIELPPINENSGDKADPADVNVRKPGEFDKKAPAEIEGNIGEGTKQPIFTPPPTTNFAQIIFSMTPGNVVPQKISILEGDLVASNSIDGEFLYVFRIKGEPRFVGTFRDPLLAVGLPDTQNPGYSASQMSEGIFAITLPGEYLTKEILTASSIDIYRLDPTIPFTTPVTPETVQTLIDRSSSFTKVDGSEIYDLLQRTQ